MIEISKHIIPELPEQFRLLDYIIQYIPEITTRNGAKKAIKKGLITLDGKVVETGRYVKTNQEIVFFKEERERKIFPQTLEVIYEDEYLAVIIKPSGIGTSGNYYKTVENALLFNIKKSNNPDALDYPLPVHRLDNQTSGLLLIAKTMDVRIELGNHFEQGLISKTYHAVIHGHIGSKGQINTPVENREALTLFNTIKTINSCKFNTLSLLELQPKTGRTHQLRIHLSSKGSPIVGDKLYTDEDKLYKGKGLFLSSTGLSFTHPKTKKALSFTMPLPNKFQAFLKRYGNN